MVYITIGGCLIWWFASNVGFRIVLLLDLLATGLKLETAQF